MGQEYKSRDYDELEDSNQPDSSNIEEPELEDS